MANLTPLSNTSPLPSVPFPSVLYPSLAELENYMGLSLSSQEVQQNLLQIPEGASVGICLLRAMGTACANSPSLLVLPFEQTGSSSCPACLGSVS